MSNDKIRELKIMAKINRTNDPYLADIYRGFIFWININFFNIFF